MKTGKFFTKKRVIWLIIILLIVSLAWYFKSRAGADVSNIQTTNVVQQNLEQTVLSTGQVVSETNLSLSFQTSGVVEQIMVNTGSEVKTGDVLAILNQSSVKANLTSANGQLAQASANYRRIVSGATPEQINVSQKAVDSAKVAYNNALSNLENIRISADEAIKQAQNSLDDLKSPTTNSDNKRSAILINIANQLAAVKVSLDKEKKILDDNDLKDTFGVMDFSSLSNFKNAITQVQPLLAKAENSLNTAQSYKSDDNINQAVSDVLAVLNQDLISLNYCYTALQNSVASSRFSQSQLDAYKTAINGHISSENSGINLIKSSKQALTDALTAATNAVTNSKLSATSQINAAQNQINSAKASLQQAEASLAQLKAKAQPAEIDAAKAQLLSAQGSVEAATAALNNTILKAPADGTITAVNTKVGQQATAMQAVFTLQNINALRAESYVSEANVASLKIGQKVNYTFDALGPDKNFEGQIMTIDPASTVISGVVNYLVKASLPNIDEIKPGMTVNMTVLTDSRENALAIPSSAIINQDGEQFVRLITDKTKKTYNQVKVITGLQADGGQVEILDGLTAEDEIVTFIK